MLVPAGSLLSNDSQKVIRRGFFGWNSPGVLRRCLKHLQRQRHPRPSLLDAQCTSITETVAHRARVVTSSEQTRMQMWTDSQVLRCRSLGPMLDAHLEVLLQVFVQLQNGRHITTPEHRTSARDVRAARRLYVAYALSGSSIAAAQQSASSTTRVNQSPLHRCSCCRQAIPCSGLSSSGVPLLGSFS